ncbi:MAG TPA: hypothetical protein VN253_21215 [Kofleriaceae bacterium]|nr:hypothetical protein [Kofleriaceae bacterium]
MAHRPAPAAPAPDLQSLQREICARARDFEIGPLLDLLAMLGYRPTDVWFRAHLALAPQPTLVHHIEFMGPDGTIAGPASDHSPSMELGNVAELSAHAPSGPRAPRAGGARSRVTVTVNLGLLSCRSPLPSYFQHLLGDPALREPLIELLQILDRNLLHARLTCDRPERLVEQWDEITSDLLRIHGLDSLIGLGWLFRHVFPELSVVAARTSERLRVPYASARLGFSDLGSACFGAMTRIDVHDFQVTLTCEESLARPGIPWVQEIDRRLRALVFPALDPVCMNLTVVVELEDDHAVATLSDEDGPQPDSYLGQDPLGQDPRSLPGAADPPVRRVILYHGLLPRDQLDTDKLEQALAAQARATLSPVPHAGRAPTAIPDDTEVTLIRGEPASDRELSLAVELGGLIHRYQATVRWGARAWFRDEPHAIELRSAHLVRSAPTARHHPHLWRLLRDRARQDLSAELTAATLAQYRATRVTDAIVADLVAHGQDAALHALISSHAAADIPRDAWERYLRAQP